MHLLLTASHSFLLLDTDSGAWVPLDQGHGLYYGIAQNDDRLYVAARHRLVSSDIEQAQESGEILIFDRALQSCGSLRAPFPLRDMHEIAWHDGKLWVTCSYEDMIAVFDGVEWSQWFPLGNSGGEPRDVHHFNSFLFEDDRIWLLAHKRGASELLGFAKESRELVDRVALGKCGHNIWRESGQLLTCSSATGRLLGEHGFSLETGGFPRGVVFDGSTRCVGVSSPAERNDRDYTSGKLMIFDRNWIFQKEIGLPGAGLILDLQPLPPGFQYAPPSPACGSVDTPLARLRERLRGEGSKPKLSRWSKLVRPFG